MSLHSLSDGRQVWRCELEDYFPPTPNELRGQTKFMTAKPKKAAYGQVLVYGRRGLRGLPCFQSPVELRITREWGKGRRALDYVNLVSACKILEDVLREPHRRRHAGSGQLIPEKYRHGIIEDDRPADYVGGEPIIEQRKSEDGRTRTIIEIIGYPRSRRASG